MSENVEIVRRVFAAFEHRDVEALRELTAPDVVFESITRRHVVDGDPDAAVTGHEPYRGHDGLREYLDDVARTWQELRPVPDRYQEPEEGLVVATGRVYAWGTGRVIDAPAGWLWRVTDGKVVYGRVFETASGALEAAGIR